MKRYKAIVVSKKSDFKAEVISALGEGFDCHPLSGVDEALEKIGERGTAEEVVRLVVLDIDLDDRGRNIVKEIRRRELERGIDWPRSARIIAVSDSEKKIVKAFFHGAEAGHLLPLDSGKLQRQVETLEVHRV